MDERRGDEATPLMVQVDCGNEEVVKELLAHNANVDLQDKVSPSLPLSYLHLTAPPSSPGRALFPHESLPLRPGEHGSDADCPQSNSGPQEQGKERGEGGGGRGGRGREGGREDRQKRRENMGGREGLTLGCASITPMPFPS